MASAEPNLAIDQALVTIAPKTMVTGFHCLVASSDESRGRLLSWAATDAGWQTTLCRDVSSALRCWERMLSQLAIVDLESSDVAGNVEYRRLIEFLAGQGGLLLLLCGNEGQPAEEIWARQLGVWMYLPGAVAGPDLTATCQEARDLAARIEGSRAKAELSNLRGNVSRGRA